MDTQHVTRLISAANFCKTVKSENNVSKKTSVAKKNCSWFVSKPGFREPVRSLDDVCMLTLESVAYLVVFAVKRCS